MARLLLFLRPTGRAMLHGQVSEPLRRFLRTESAGAVVLVVATVIALVWANSPASGAYTELLEMPMTFGVGDLALTSDLHHLVNDGLMTLFFLVVGLEVRRELSLGELTDRRRVVVPAVAAVAGLAVPAALYLSVAGGTPGAAPGWGVVIGTDTAFLLGALAVVGPRPATQLRLFLLTLTVIDDILAVSVIGVAYTERLDVVALAVAGACLAALVVLGRRNVWQSAPYVVVVLVLWAATVRSGLHPSIAGMAAGLLVPAVAPQRDVVEGAAAQVRAFRQSPQPTVARDARRGIVRAISVNERLQTELHPWTSWLVVPLFALVNAGVDLRGGALGDALRSPVTWGVVLGLVLGKLVGVGGGALLATRLGLGRLPQGVGSGHVLGGAALSGIGFTVSLLIADLAFTDEDVRRAAVVGVLLAAVLATLVGTVVFALAAALLGQRSADLPHRLSIDVDPERDHVRGPVDAPLTLVEYLDFECPFCAKATGVGRELREHFGDELRYVVRHLPLPDVHQHAERAAMAAEAAAAQGRFWEMHDLLFAHQEHLHDECLIGYASELGLDVERFAADLASPALAARVRADVAGAEASGARGTPTFFVEGVRHTGPHDTASLVAVLEAARGRRVSPPAPTLDGR